MKTNVEDDCSIILTLKILGRKWTIYVLSELLMEGQKGLYFSELQKHLRNRYDEQISSRVLSDCLSNLESFSIVKKEVESEKRPIRVKYYLTQKGNDFKTVLAVFKGWGIKWGNLQQKKCQSFNCIHNTVPAINLDVINDYYLLKPHPDLISVEVKDTDAKELKKI